MFETAYEEDVFGGRVRPAETVGCSVGAPVPGTSAASTLPLDELSPDLQGLVTAADAVASGAPTSLPEAQALADTAALLRVIEQLGGALLVRLADVDARRLHTLDDSPSTATWVAAQGTSLDRDQVTLARRMARFPTVADAVRDGGVPVSVAARVSRALAKLRPLVDRPDGLIDGQPGEQVVTAVVCDGVREAVCQALGGLAEDDPRLAELTDQLSEISCWPTSQLARLEAAFVLLARHVPAGELRDALALLVDALLPEELERRAARGREQAGLVLRRKDDGSGWLISKGELDLECGELLHTVLTAMSAVDPDGPVDTEAWKRLRADGWQDGDELPVCGAPRSRARRAHDALRLALRLLLDSGMTGTRDKVAPHLLITVGLDTLHAQPGARPATAASGATVPLSLVRAWWCESAVSRFVLSLGRRVIETSHTERTLKAHERRAKHLETGGRCQGAGCRCGPGQKLIPHHPDAWARCGTTSLANSVLFCERTHTEVHNGKTIRLKDGRRLNADGWVT